MFSTQLIKWASPQRDFTPDPVIELLEEEIFVFGSNLAGIHGKGAALAAQKWGAERGVGVGFSGRTYGIPTKVTPRNHLPLSQIAGYVEGFKFDAANNYQLVFLVTKIGTGLAGNSIEDIGPLFEGCTPNVVLPKEFEKYR